MTHKNRENEFLDDIMDIFMADGWLGFEKIILIILEENKEKIFKMGFDHNFLFMNNLGKEANDIIKTKDFNLKKAYQNYKRLNLDTSKILKNINQEIQVLISDF